MTKIAPIKSNGRARKSWRKTSASHWDVDCTLGNWRCTCANESSMNFVAPPIASPGNKLKLNVTLVNCTKGFTDCGPTTCVVDVTVRNGTSSDAVPVVVVIAT